MATVNEMIQKWENTSCGRVRQDIVTKRWYYMTLGGTCSREFATDTAARKTMLKADNESRYWEAFHAAKGAGKADHEAHELGTNAMVTL